MLTIQAQARDPKAKLADLRDQDIIPAVYYSKGEDAVSITVVRNDFIRVYREAGESTIITLETPAGSLNALIQDVQVEPDTHKLVHADFKLITAGEAIKVSVPLEFVGDAPAEKDGLGTVTKSLQEIEIEVLPKDLPSSIEVSLESLVDLSANIYAKDITIPGGATLITDPESVVASAVALVEESEDEAAAEIDFDAIAVEQKGKGEEAADQ